MEDINSQIEKATQLWDYANEKLQDEREVNSLLTRLGFDNPSVLIEFPLGKCKQIIDKMIRVRIMMREN